MPRGGEGPRLIEPDAGSSERKQLEQERTGGAAVRDEGPAVAEVTAALYVIPTETPAGRPPQGFWAAVWQAMTGLAATLYGPAESGRQPCMPELLRVRNATSATRPRASGTARISSAASRLCSQIRRWRPTCWSDSVSGAPSSLVSLVKIANNETRRGAQPPRSPSITSRTRCSRVGRLTTDRLPLTRPVKHA